MHHLTCDFDIWYVSCNTQGLMNIVSKILFTISYDLVMKVSWRFWTKGSLNESTWLSLMYISEKKKKNQFKFYDFIWNTKFVLVNAVSDVIIIHCLNLVPLQLMAILQRRNDINLCQNWNSVLTPLLSSNLQISVKPIKNANGLCS